MADNKNYLKELFQIRGLEVPLQAEPMVGTGLVPTSQSDAQMSGEARFMSSLAALLYNVEPVQEDGGEARFDKGEVMKAIARIDGLIESQVNEILHAEEFQKMESVWRGLDDLVQQTNFQADITIDLLDVTKDELSEDFEKNSSNIFSSALFDKMYIKEYDQFGGKPYGVMLGLYEFSASRQDLTWLERMGKVANAAHCPFISAVSPKFFDCDSVEQLESLKDLDGVLSHPRYSKWMELRDKEEAAYIGLTLPRYVVRLPWDPDINPCDVLNFKEDAEGDSKKYLWGNTAYLLGRNLVKAFEQSGWCQSIRGPKGGGLVTGLPVDTFTLRGQKMIQAPVEIAIPDYREYEFARNGFIPLVHRKGSSEATFFSTQSIKRAKKFKDPKDSENSQLVTNLAYTFSITRLAHYIKSIARDNIGSTADAAYVQRELDSWLAGYITTVVNPDDPTVRRFPFKATQVIVESRPGELGWYDCKVAVMPHVQFEGLNVKLMLESRLG
ncbi:type VI secretion system protein ImpC [Stigmatella aurantiaca]|uniref:Type VI secretion system protein ImpC n=1 Tax=Stigmatella aurantiaca TaxID=41 RepID=A0A1H7TWL6_STIAU|nr:type VI secretion system contractile sheath large subunit [Stigmatella aurantiaca]SEL89272.1 type VI secretion system protein ImpC [Stigmatella aurantiaca]